MKILCSYFLFLFRTFKVSLLFFVVLGGISFFPSYFSSSGISDGFVLSDEGVFINEVSFIPDAEFGEKREELERVDIPVFAEDSTITNPKAVSTEATPQIFSDGHLDVPTLTTSSRNKKNSEKSVPETSSDENMSPVFSMLLQNQIPDNLSPLWSKKIDSLTENGPTTLADQDRYGVSIANLGDLDGDGVTDVAVGAHRSDVGGTDRGSLFIHFRNVDGSIKSTYVINSQTPGAPALADGDLFGVSVANIGDLNADGTTDIAVGSYADDTGGENRGAVYIIFLNPNGSIQSFKKIDSNTSTGPSNHLNDLDRYGASISHVGDRDGDGVQDIAVGAQYNHIGGVDKGGAMFMHFMNADGSVKSTKVFNYSTPRITPAGLSLKEADYYGLSIANLGDINQDGVEDLAVGAVGDNSMGTSTGAWYLHFMNADETIASTVKINGDTPHGPSLSAFDYYGTIANIGDLDNDGINDVAVGAEVFPNTDSPVNQGMVYIHFLNIDGSIKSSLKIDGETPGGPTLNDNDFYGTSIAHMGDLNNDGKTDIAVGSFWDDTGGMNRGAIYIHYLYSTGADNDDIVLPFNSTTCPSGWSEYTPAKGRMILGVGNSNTSGSMHHTLGEMGGKETHAQTTLELVSHQHTSTVLGNNGNSVFHYLNQNGLQYESGNNSINYVSVGSFAPMNVSAGSSGSGEAMPFMNPYVALIFCVKSTDSSQNIPAGAVSAFTSATCPSGWSEYTPAKGRMILGVGNSNTSGSVHHALGEMGGKETHAQTTLELASHSHSVNVSGGNGNNWVYHLNQNGLQYEQGNNSINYVSGGTFTNLSGNSFFNTAGSGSPMPIMNPYVALLYCEKIDPIPQPAPLGSVVPFNSESCPADWSEYTPAKGRMILGVGNSNTSGSVHHALGEMGGKETHAQTESELALHSHQMTFSNNPSNGWVSGLNQNGLQHSPGGNQGNNYVSVGNHTVPTITALSAGSGTAMPLMNPYTTLNYCVRSLSGGGGGSDLAGFTVFPTSITLQENGGTGVFSVVLDVAPVSDVTLSFTPQSNDQIALSILSATFTPQNWNTPQVVTVTGINDNLDQDESVNIIVSVVDGVSDNLFDTLSDKTVLVSLTDDDTAVIDDNGGDNNGNGNGGGGGGGSTRYACHDPNALNYNPKFKSKPSLCKYGEVLGATTISCTADIYLTKPIRLGYPNNPDDVMLLEKFLNTYEGANLQVDGIYSLHEHNLVVAWQEKYSQDVLAPWGLTKGTGFVFMTSLQKIKQIHKGACAASELPTQILSCSMPLLYPTKTITLGGSNDPGQVMLLEKYLNTYESASLPVDGVYSTQDVAAVIKWQEKYADDILKPLGLTKGTGNVLYESLEKIKQTHMAKCALFVVNPEF